jgi:hypothetical protein
VIAIELCQDRYRIYEEAEKEKLYKLSLSSNWVEAGQ